MVQPATLLAVPLTAAAPALIDQARAARALGADLIELRADLIDDWPAVRGLLSRPRELTIILTIRSVAEGGNWRASDAARAVLFEQVAETPPDYVDLEFAAWRRSPELRAAVHRICRLSGADPHPERPRPAGPRLILSHHDVSGTPQRLTRALPPMLASPADVVKVVVAARHALDACRVLAQLQQCAPGHKVTLLATEPGGLVTRVLSRKFGAFMTFAALQAGRESAPGQPTLDELVNVYRWRETNSATRVYGVVGWPLGHSRSPTIHNAAMRAAGINAVYMPLPVPPTYRALAAFMDYVSQQPHLDLDGLSVTIPHKEHVCRWLLEHSFPVSEVARRVGAINTLTRTAPAAWAGDNTDVAGFLAVLALMPEPAGPREAAVLGAGGVARAAVCALHERGYRVTVFNRTAERAARLARELACVALPWKERVHSPARVIVNCTSLGMLPDAEATPLPAAALPCGPTATVIDAVYTPAHTRLLREAQQRGCRTVSGAEMFLAQAAAQFERWHQRPAPREVMREHLNAE